MMANAEFDKTIDGPASPCFYETNAGCFEGRRQSR
jgi:hypothetical protein